jgi:hypothetical protein
VFTGTNGLIPKDEESPMLKHILRWFESVVIIDEFEKMKLKSAKPGTMFNLGGVIIPNTSALTNVPEVDNSADEIIRSIASTGKYKFMNKVVDCSKILFLITTNETREEVEKNFGISGIKGGGAQRLNIIEFDYLTLDACLGIAKDFVEKVIEILTDKEGPFKIGKITFDNESLKNIAQHIFNDKVMQGRAKNELEDEIYSLFSENIGKEKNKKIRVSFNDGHFTKQISR